MGTHNSDLKAIKNRHLIMTALKSGLFGYIVFFCVLSLAKLLNSQIYAGEKFLIEVNDATLCLVGFLLAFLMKLIESISNKAN